MPSDHLLAVVRAAGLSGPEWQACSAAFVSSWEARPDLAPLMHQRADGLLGVWEAHFLPPTRHYPGLEPFLARLRELANADLWVCVALADSVSWAVYFSNDLSQVEAFVGTDASSEPD